MKDLQDADSVARFCSYQRQIRDENDQVIGVIPQFFELRPNISETYLSCEWIEFYKGEREEQLSAVVEAVRNRVKSKSKKAKVAILNVEKIKICGSERERKLRVQQRKKTSSYSGIYGLPQDNNDITLLKNLTDYTIEDLIDYVSA